MGLEYVLNFKLFFSQCSNSSVAETVTFMLENRGFIYCMILI